MTSAELKMVLVALAAVTVGVVAGSMAGAQESAPWPAPEVCNDALLADYELRGELIFDLMMDLQECRLRYGGCVPGSTWIIREMERHRREGHPEIERREQEERERWHREVEAEMEAEERAETTRP